MTARLKSRIGGLAAVAGVVLSVAACGSSSTKSTTASASTGTASTGTPSSSGGSALTIGSARGSAGTYLVGASGRALYMWVADKGGKSVCSGACAQTWPPVTSTGTPAVSGGVSASDIGTSTRSDGSKQVTYKGHPLYYFAGDPSSGSTHGQGSTSFGAKWWLVAPSGAVITSSSSSSGNGSSGGSGYGSGGSGYG
jgi:predicted lipoprotein with Yx(FWY)xxD motif